MIEAGSRIFIRTRRYYLAFSEGWLSLEDNSPHLYASRYACVEQLIERLAIPAGMGSWEERRLKSKSDLRRWDEKTKQIRQAFSQGNSFTDPDTGYRHIIWECKMESQCLSSPDHFADPDDFRLPEPADGNAYLCNSRMQALGL